jgi:hypothetical protein
MILTVCRSGVSQPTVIVAGQSEHYFSSIGIFRFVCRCAHFCCSISPMLRIIYVIRGHYASVLGPLSGIIALKYAAANSH